MTAGGIFVGAIALSFPTDRDFPPAERAFCETLAGQAAQAFRRATEADQRRGIADTLQRTLLPPELPVLERVAMAAHYEPAAIGTQAGGDWYDVLPLPGDRVAVVVGDVVGHGPAAAAVMGQLRSALAAYLLDGHDPAQALDRLSRFARRVPGAVASTAVCVVLDPGAGRLHWARAGHPPPLVLTTEGTAYLDDGPGCVLGLRNAPPYVGESLDLRPGSTVLLYTDGLVERRDECIDDGLARLAHAAAGAGALDYPDRLLAVALARSLDGLHAPDDVAAVVARLLPPPLRLRLPARPDELRHLRTAVGSWAAAHALGEPWTDDLQLVVGEAAANSVEHGYAGTSSGAVDCSLRRSPAGVHVEVVDTGTWRPARSAPGYRGHGLAVIRSLGADVHIGSDDSGTRVRLVLPAPGAAPSAGPAAPVNDRGAPRRS